MQDIDDDEFYDVEPLPILGKCRGLYTFEGKIISFVIHLKSKCNSKQKNNEKRD